MAPQDSGSVDQRDLEIVLTLAPLRALSQS